MSFKVRLFLGAPDFETLHVAKLREYPLEPRDYKPYAQARICFAADGLHVQLLSFESKPLPQSEVRVVLALTPGAPPLIISLRADGVLGRGAAKPICRTAAGPLCIPSRARICRGSIGAEISVWNRPYMPGILSRIRTPLFSGIFTSSASTQLVRIMAVFIPPTFRSRSIAPRISAPLS